MCVSKRSKQRHYISSPENRKRPCGEDTHTRTGTTNSNDQTSIRTRRARKFPQRDSQYKHDLGQRTRCMSIAATRGHAWRQMACTSAAMGAARAAQLGSPRPKERTRKTASRLLALKGTRCSTCSCLKSRRRSSMIQSWSQGSSAAAVKTHRKTS